MTRRIAICLLAFFWATPLVGAEVSRPSLILTAEAVRDIKAARTSYPFFETAFDEAVGRVERSLREGVVVPMPKDPGGGYTHERHKENSKVIHDAGLLYQLTGKQAYLDHARTLLLAYADMYPDLPLHPARKAQSPGKLFWQILNESVWLVYAVQGYDAIAEGLGDADRTRIENDLLRPMADFLSLGSPETFRKIHNHATWAAAAVGMTGYALRDQSLVDRALQGLDGDGSSGFLAQLERLFSPDGYYTEGPYYQRYALMPFILFAQSIEHNDPQQKIFAYRDGILLKAIDATIQQSYAGKFFPINDAIKEKGLDTPELVYAVATAYGLTHRKDLLSIAKYQGKTILSGDGLAVARAMANGVEGDFAFRSLLLRDGPHGDRGALAIMRMGAGALAQTVIAKNTSHGFGHGHFDKLAIAVFDHGREILADYGAARFLNVPTKDGGRYLP
ncbi:MAG: alginate lyase, partial [Alphaproteobacteria bacterium]